MSPRGIPRSIGATHAYSREDLDKPSTPPPAHDRVANAGLSALRGSAWSCGVNPASTRYNRCRHPEPTVPPRVCRYSIACPELVEGSRLWDRGLGKSAGCPIQVVFWLEWDGKWPRQSEKNRLNRCGIYIYRYRGRCIILQIACTILQIACTILQLACTILQIACIILQLSRTILLHHQHLIQ